MTGFVLLPGAGGDPWDWHLVASRLDGLGYDVVPVALPAADEAAGLEDYVAVTLAAAVGLREVVLVAQSMGAFTAAMAAANLPTVAIALVNPMIPVPGETPGQWWGATGQASAQAAARGDRDPVEDFVHDLPPWLAQELLERPFAQGAMVFDSPCDVDGWPPVPIHVLVGADDRVFPAGFQHRLCRERLSVEPTVIPGGHALALSQPGAVVRWLHRIGSSLPRPR